MQSDPNITLQLEEVPCDYCGAAEADVVLTHGDPLGHLQGTFTVVACRKCGLRRTNPRPTAATLGNAYPSGYECHQGGVAEPPTGFLRWALVNFRNYPLGKKSPALLRWLGWPGAALRLRNRKFVGYLPYRGGGRLLDFGCGGGRYVAQMAAVGWKAEGIDLVPAAVETGRKAGLTIHQGTLPGASLPKQTYDLVTMWHVLEHVPSPMATLKAVREILKPDGRLALVCPMGNSLTARCFGGAWYGTDLPRHLTHFTLETLERHLEAAGFAVERAHAIRRPTFLRRSLGIYAADSKKPFYAALGRSRVLARVLSHVALWLGETSEVLITVRLRKNEE